MLNADTKRRINACRDILVGKVTDPKAQVEQITIALMYKFMNDLDHEVRDLGGTASFFAGDFAAYSWDRITDTRLGGEERLKLYADGIEKVVTNPGVPELFRQIFRNAYLPYRDPETFNLFSQEISGFTYDHSEDLGDAFEYLLSVMQSQGDAGQFRTPRHIIDFMVEVLKPQPGEAVLDPACGTAGFLISAYKHIVQHHPKLTPAQLEDLHRKVEGYDISPDMVRLSRVNLYLHQFADPRVIEYDTLTSDDRWGQRFDVILANPPFMTPKGGIRPHRKFSLESNRSEVLFVDYIAEHLMAGGRAAVIVPEGIIFQSGKAYRQLRRMLVENSLWAVASLPAGVFNPYSGVKTSILFLDRGIAEKGGPVLFAQIKADGHDLGAQRRVVAANDLPAALALLDDAHHRLKTGQVPADYRDGLGEHPGLTHLFVPRAVILAEADFNLSGERYRVAAATGPKKWPMVKLGEVCVIERGASPRPIQDFITDDPDGENWIKIGDSDLGSMYLTSTETRITKAGAQKSRRVAAGDLILSNSMSFGRPYILKIDGYIHDGWLALREIDKRLILEYLFHVLASPTTRAQFERLATGGVVNNLNSKLVALTDIPLPPLSVQQEIVAEVARYQAVIDGARQVVDHWKPSFAVDPEWSVVKLGEVADFKNGLNYDKASSGKSVRILGVKDFQDFDFIRADDLDQLSVGDISSELFLKTGDIVFVRSNGNPALVGRSILFEGFLEPVTFTGFSIRARFATEIEVLPRFALAVFKSDAFRESLLGGTRGANIGNINQDLLGRQDFPLPPLDVQCAIVERIEAEHALVDGNKKLIELMKTRIEETMQRVWN